MSLLSLLQKRQTSAEVSAEAVPTTPTAPLQEIETDEITILIKVKGKSWQERTATVSVAWDGAIRLMGKTPFLEIWSYILKNINSDFTKNSETTATTDQKQKTDEVHENEQENDYEELF